MIYPLVKIPEGIKQIIDWNPLSGEQPIKPSYPEKPSIPQSTYPVKPSQPILASPPSASYRIPLILAIMVSIYQCSVNENKNRSKNEFFAILTVTLLVGLIVLMTKIARQKYSLELKFNQDQHNYQKAVKEWQNQCEVIDQDRNNIIKRSESEFSSKILEYENVLLPRYKKELDDFEVYTKSIQGVNKGNSLKIDKLGSYCSENCSKSVIYQSEYKPFTGVSESDFYNVLQEKIDNWQWINVEILLSKNKSITNTNYLPDILIECIWKDGPVLYIDVEIDEPYIGSNGVPIHYIDSGNEDEKRDNVFLKNNWLVIRFCEEQVIKYPKECCKYILSVILRSTEPMGNEELIENGITSVPAMNRWTKDQAHAMAFKRYRNNYLGRKLSESVFTET